MTEPAEDDDTAEEKIGKILDDEPFYDDRVEILINALVDEVASICKMTEADERSLMKELADVVARCELAKVPIESRSRNDVN